MPVNVLNLPGLKILDLKETHHDYREPLKIVHACIAA